jgi:biopolymer transport protein ExbB
MNINTYIEQGGVIVLILIAMFVLGMILIVWKLLTITFVKLKQEDIYEKYSCSLPQNSDITVVELVVHSIMHRLERGLDTIKIIATVSPLLGLLGTVIGIYSAFVSISEHGLGNPSYFADGISMAMITTIAGLIVAIPHYIGYNYIVGMMDKLELYFTAEIYARIKSENA